MLTLSRFEKRLGRAGMALPPPFVTFRERYVGFRQGQTSMIAGKPGSFKSVLALNLLDLWVREHKTVLYLSADGDEQTLVQRMAGILTGRDVLQQVQPDFAVGRYDPYRQALKTLDRYVRFEQDALDLDSIEGYLAAFDAAWGEPPDIVFVDNLVNFAAPGDWNEMARVLLAFDSMAKKTGSHFSTLHHASEANSRPGDPVPSSAIQGKLTTTPTVVLTVWCQENALGVACVKNRHGPSDPGATRPMAFNVAPSLRVIDDYRREVQ